MLAGVTMEGSPEGDLWGLLLLFVVDSISCSTRKNSPKAACMHSALAQ